MSALTHEDIQKHVRIYIMVFVALAALTVVTVAISYVHLPTTSAVALAMAVALIKGGLVAGFFMHLLSEKSVIYWVLILCVFMFVVLMAVPVFTDTETQRYAAATTTPFHLETPAASH